MNFTTVFRFRIIAAVTVFALLLFKLSDDGSQAHAQAEENSQPNILFIFADDLAYDCIASYGNDQVQTPNLNRLARRSTTFTHCYNMGGWNGAVCQASRAMLNTGQFIWQAEQADKKLNSDYVPQKRMWSQMMQSAGYDTYFTGKWHVSTKPQKIFDTVKNVHAGMPKQTKAGYNRPLSREDTTWQPWDKSFGGFWEGGKHWSEVVADDAEEFLGAAKDSENPFFMYIAFNAAHDPRQSPKEFVDMYPVDDVDIPQPFFAEYPLDIGIRKCRDELLAPYPRTDYSVKKNRQEYYAIITHMDREIGRILAALEKSGKADNTYIIFTADHGLACGHHGLMGKQNMYDHSMRTPFMISGPGIPMARKHDAKIYVQDMMPTTLELAGIEKPEQVDFQSVLPLIRGEKKTSYDVIYGAYIDFQRMIIDGDYKLIDYPKIGKQRLFNLRSDPSELNDLISDPSQSERLIMLSKKLLSLQEKMGDPLVSASNPSTQDSASDTPNDGPLVYQGTEGSGVGKHIVFLAGDHEYRSEEALPALARILAKHHGCKCTVLFNIDPETGTIKPGNNNMPYTDGIATADLLVFGLRFQSLPPEQMQPIVDYLDRAGPVIGTRTSTHAFKYPADSKYAKYDFQYKGEEMTGGFGRQVLGETWAGHYGTNHVMSTRLEILPAAKDHPVLRGVSNPWVEAGGYWTDPEKNSVILADAQPLQGMTPDSPPAADKVPCPGAWVRTYKGTNGAEGRVFTTTYCASEDLRNDGFRRLMVNGCLWALSLDDKITADLNVDFVGPYNPATFAFEGYRRDVTPQELAGWESPIMSTEKEIRPGKPKSKKKKSKQPQQEKEKEEKAAAAQ